jgi:hypothetical protein
VYTDAWVFFILLAVVYFGAIAMAVGLLYFVTGLIMKSGGKS